MDGLAMKEDYLEYTKEQLISICHLKDETMDLFRKTEKLMLEQNSSLEYKIGLLEARIEELENSDQECSWY